MVRTRTGALSVLGRPRTNGQGLSDQLVVVQHLISDAERSGLTSFEQRAVRGQLANLAYNHVDPDLIRWENHQAVVAVHKGRVLVAPRGCRSDDEREAHRERLCPKDGLTRWECGEVAGGHVTVD